MLGIVEGFYGTAWSAASRRAALGRLASWGYDAYVYAPKWDPYHRKEWRTPYPAEAEKELDALAAACAANGIRGYFTLSPGLDFSYSSPEDLKIVEDKLAWALGKGWAGVGVLFDDTPAFLASEADAARFGSAAEAQNSVLAELSARLDARTGKRTEILACPSPYCGSHRTSALRDFCAGLPDRVKVFWTGRSICSPFISEADAKEFRAHTGKKPLYWDNYPVNDSIMSRELHLGPYGGREPGIVSESEGIVLNPMDKPWSSLIALRTAADFYRLGAAYDPAASWDAALDELVPPGIRESYGFFASFCWKSCLSPYFSNPRLMEELAPRFVVGKWDYGVEGEALRERIAAAAAVLSAHGEEPLVREALPWIRKFGELERYAAAHLEAHRLRRRAGRAGGLAAAIAERRLRRRKDDFHRVPEEIFQLEYLDELAEGPH